MTSCESCSPTVQDVLLSHCNQAPLCRGGGKNFLSIFSQFYPAPNLCEGCSGSYFRNLLDPREMIILARRETPVVVLLVLLSAAHLSFGLTFITPCSTGGWNCSGKQGAVSICSPQFSTSSSCCVQGASTSITCSTSSAAVPISGLSESFCLSDSAQRVCSSGFVVKGMCVGTTNCTPCRSNSAGRLICSSLVAGRSLNNSARRWQVTDGSGRASCVAGYEAMTGLCVSSTPTGCNGAPLSIQCCAFQSVNFSRSSTLSETKLLRFQNSASTSPTPSNERKTGTITIQKSASRRISKTRSTVVTISRWSETESMTVSQSVATLTLSKLTQELTVTHLGSGSVSETYSGQLSKSSSMTTRPPTRTPYLSQSRTAYDSGTTQELILVAEGIAARGGITAKLIHNGPTSILAVLKRSTWQYKAVPFIDQQIFGSEFESPFGWNEQKEATFDSVQYIPGNQSVIRILLKANVCYEAAETLTLVASSQFTTASGSLSSTIQISGSSIASTRHVIAIVTIVLTMLLLTISAFLGNQGVAVLMFMEMQVTTVLGSQSCSRANIRDYYSAIFWIVTPTKFASVFSFDPHFGVVLLHCILPVACFSAYVMVCRMKKRARLFFPSLPMTFGYLTIIGATSHAWLDIVHAEYHVGWRIFSVIAWLLFVGAVALSVYRIRSPRGLQFLSYSGTWKLILSGTYFPQQLRSKYALLTDMWNEEYMQYSSPVHLLHLSTTTVISALSWSTVAGCFVVLSLQLTWQLVIMLLIFWNRPGRSLFHNVILITQACNQLLIVIAQVISLDCGGRYPTNVDVAEGIVLLTLLLHFLLAAAVCIGIRYERGHRIKTQLEAQQAAYKLREETLMLQGGVSSTRSNDVAIKRGFPVLPNIKYHEMNPRVSTDASLVVTERQKRLAEDNFINPSNSAAVVHPTTSGTYFSSSAQRAESVEMKEMSAFVRSRLWKEVSLEEEARQVEEMDRNVVASAQAPIVPLAVALQKLQPGGIPFQVQPTRAAPAVQGSRCRRCLQRLSASGVCSNCEGLSYL